MLLSFRDIQVPNNVQDVYSLCLIPVEYILLQKTALVTLQVFGTYNNKGCESARNILYMDGYPNYVWFLFSHKSFICSNKSILSSAARFPKHCLHSSHHIYLHKTLWMLPARLGVRILISSFWKNLLNYNPTWGLI